MNQKRNLDPGDAIGKCEIVQRLGKGGMGAVYLAVHATLRIYVAVKVLDRALAEDHPQLADRFIREAQIAARIRHPHVVAIMDADYDAATGLYYIVMEYIEGGSLAERLMAGPLDGESIFWILHETTQALVVAAQHNIVHRDIKPDNIMLDREGKARLSDLGLAKMEAEGNKSLTIGGAMLGTPAYMSPQQAADAKQADVRDDIYSLGATLYQCLTGKAPYQGDSALGIVTKVITAPPPDPRSLKMPLPPALVAICLKMMARASEERYGSAAELLEELERVRAQGLHSVDGLLAEPFLRQAARLHDEARAAGIELPGDAEPYPGGRVTAKQPPLSPERWKKEGIWFDWLPGWARQTVGAGWLWCGSVTVLVGLLAGWYGLVERPRQRQVEQLLAARGHEPAPPVALERAPLPDPAPEPPPQAGGIFVVAEPRDAWISITGHEPARSPATFKGLPPGKYEVTVRRDGYDPEILAVQVSSGEIATPAAVKLERSKGTLEIRPNVKGGSYVLTGPDGTGQVRNEGQAPRIIRNVPTGTYEVEVRFGDAVKHQPVEVRRGETAVVQPQFAFGSVWIDSKPAGATVWQNDKPLGKTPLDLECVPVGPVQFKVGLDGYKTASIRDEVEVGQSLELSVQLKRSAAEAVAEATPGRPPRRDNEIEKIERSMKKLGDKIKRIFD